MHPLQNAGEATGAPVGRPSVSVIVPLYNKRSTVERTIDSILAQSFGSFELLVIDDGSTDGGAEFVEQRYSDPRLRLTRQANAGPGAARNHGLALARAPLVTFLDADDAWEKELLGTAVAKLEAHPACAAFTASYFREPAHLPRWQDLRAFGFAEGPWRLAPDTPRKHLRHCLDAFHACTAVYRSDVVRAYGGFFAQDRCSLGEDVYLWVQIMLNHAIYRHETPLAAYHMEDSELGIAARRGALPMEPVLTHAGPVRAACPPHLSTVFELWLALHAAEAASMQLDRGDTGAARWLMATFPTMRRWRYADLKLRLRLLSPALWGLLRRLRGRPASGPRPG